MGNCRSKSCPAVIDEQQKLPIPAPTSFSSLPADMLYSIAASLTLPKDLLCFSSVNKSQRQLVQDADNLLWGPIVKKKWVSHHSLIEEAVEIRGSYMAFAMEKHRSSKQPGPEGWFVACEAEQLASIRRIGSTLKREGASGPGNLVFLIDGSGSVSQEEFLASTHFVIKCSREVRRLMGNVKISVVQFSSGARVEYPLDDDEAEGIDTETESSEVQDEGFEEIISCIARIGGGTHLNPAFEVAGRIFKAAASRSSLAGPNTVVLICDGRIDSAQAREAMSMSQQLSDEHNPTMFAFGVGRGVERDQLEDIISPCAPSSETAGAKYQKASERYVDLFFKLDGPW